MRIVRFLLLLLALFSVMSRLAPCHHCEHHHSATEQHESDEPLDDPCHSHHCACHHPCLMAPLQAESTCAPVLVIDAKKIDIHHWKLPDDPVYPLDIPPIIGQA